MGKRVVTNVRQLNHQRTQATQAQIAQGAPPTRTDAFGTEAEISAVSRFPLSDNSLAEPRCLVAWSAGRRRRLSLLISNGKSRCEANLVASVGFRFGEVHSIVGASTMGGAEGSMWNADSGTKPVPEEACTAVRPLGWIAKARGHEHRSV